MAKLQIFVLIVALSQAYASIAISTLPGTIDIATLPGTIEIVPETRPDEVPSISDLVEPPCVGSIRALLEAIIAKLPAIEIEEPRPLPIDPIEPETEAETVPEEDTPVLETPCTACFEYINNLLTSAEKAIAVRKMAAMLRMR